jgi:hypothetical protein
VSRQPGGLRDQLVDELLGDQPAESAERMLRVQISRLRKAVAGRRRRSAIFAPGAARL